MKLPQGSVLEIDHSKIKHYLLDPSHPDGKAKAAFFIANGVNLNNAQYLKDLLKQQARDHEIASTITTVVGEKYIFESLMEFPNRKHHTIRSVWIRRPNEITVKSVTAYKI